FRSRNPESALYITEDHHGRLNGDDFARDLSCISGVLGARYIAARCDAKRLPRVLSTGTRGATPRGCLRLVAFDPRPRTFWLHYSNRDLWRFPFGGCPDCFANPVRSAPDCPLLESTKAEA